MADHPYRVYRGGRAGEARPGDPVLDLPGAAPAAEPGERRSPVVLPPDGAPPSAPRPRRRPPWRRVIGWGSLLLVVGLVGWLGVGYRAFDRSVQRANDRLERLTRSNPVGPVLDRPGGLLISRPTTILVLGRDRTGRSDSMQLVRLDPGRHLVASLAIPRDLRVDIPGVGSDRINAAYANGGAALAIETVRDLTGVRVNHVVIVSFDGFRRLIDAVGGVDLVNRERLSSDFDGHTYHFKRGPLHLNGTRALAYARIRKNADDPADSDVTRVQRQQRVMTALKQELVSAGTLLRLRSVGAAAAEPLATDLSAAQIIQLGWVDFRADRHLACHLGGDPVVLSGASYLAGVAENRDVVAAFLGETAPSPVRSDPFAPGCS